MNKPIARRDNIVVQKLEGETLVYDLKENKAFCLNESSALIWESCNGKNTVEEICDKVGARLNTIVTEDFVYLALDQLNGEGLTTGYEGDYFGATSRREVIKKIGFTAAIGLPIVSSLVAPNAAMAQSMLAANGQACTPQSDALCTSNNCLAAGGGAGICCDAGSTQANPPSYNICTTDGSAAAFAFRCCSGNASPVGGGAPCAIGEVRYVCDPY